MTNSTGPTADVKLISPSSLPPLPPCTACSRRPMFWPQNPPGGHWCQSHTFSPDPERWSGHWRASHLRTEVENVREFKTLRASWSCTVLSLGNRFSFCLPLCITERLWCRCSKALTIYGWIIRKEMLRPTQIKWNHYPVGERVWNEGRTATVILPRMSSGIVWPFWITFL